MQANDRVRNRRTGTEAVVIRATPSGTFVYVRRWDGQVERWKRREVEVMG